MECLSNPVVYRSVAAKQGIEATSLEGQFHVIVASPSGTEAFECWGPMEQSDDLILRTMQTARLQFGAEAPLTQAVSSNSGIARAVGPGATATAFGPGALAAASGESAMAVAISSGTMPALWGAVDVCQARALASGKQAQASAITLGPAPGTSALAMADGDAASAMATSGSVNETADDRGSRTNAKAWGQNARSQASAERGGWAISDARWESQAISAATDKAEATATSTGGETSTVTAKDGAHLYATSSNGAVSLQGSGVRTFANVGNDESQPYSHICHDGEYLISH